MQNTKLIFSDVDHTLVTPTNYLSDTLKEAMKLAIANDIEFVMCSGRPTSNLIAIAKELREEGIKLNYVSGYNGSEIYCLNKEEKLVANRLEKDEVALITDYLSSKGYEFLTYDDKDIYTSHVDGKLASKEYSLTGLQRYQYEEHRTSPKVLSWVEPEEMASAIKEMRETFPQFTITQSTPYFMEVTKLNVDKASGLKAMCEILDIDLEHSYGFGDGGNDFTMLELCPNAVTVENASDELKEVCIHVADVAENDGVSKFIINKLS